MRFSYLLDKIADAPFRDKPFRHIQINDFLSDADFRGIVSSPEVSVADAESDDALFDALFDQGYKIIDFPGCITDRGEYVRWHATKARNGRTSSACEGFGVTLRLMEARSPVMVELREFLEGDPFQAAIADKFGIVRDQVKYDAGIQKYLDGYEISPHPDIRRKALTYMVNVNPRDDSEACEHHTHYLKLVPSRQYVQAFWEGNPQADRCWVPWSWCETVKTQPENNSIVMFAPGNDTMHAVKARYDHLTGQRTQLYGNFWYSKSETTSKPEWEDFDFGKSRSSAAPSILKRVKSVAKRITSGADAHVADRTHTIR